MNKLRMLAPGFFFILCFWSFSSNAADGPLQVLQKFPMGEVNAPNPITEITVTFSQPMVSLTDPKTMSAFCPFHFTPDIPGKCSWRGTNTVVFVPSQALPVDRHYEVAIPQGTKSQVSGASLDADVTWKFNTQRPQVRETRPYEREGWVGQDPLLMVAFDMDVDPDQVLRSAVLSEWVKNEAGAKVTLSAHYATLEEIKKTDGFYWARDTKKPIRSVVVFQPAERLKLGQAYYLMLKRGLLSLNGEVGMANDRVIRFSTVNEFSFAGHSEPTGCLEEQPVKLTFTNPVDTKELIAHLRVESNGGSVDVHSLSEVNRDPEGKTVTYALPGSRLQPNATCTVRLTSGLKDLFGNILSDGKRYSFHAGDRCARLTMTQGFGVLESYLGHRLPVASVNATDVPMKLAQVRDDQVIPLLKALKWNWYDYGEYDYGEEGDGDDENEDWSEENIKEGRIHADAKKKEKALESILNFTVDRPWKPQIEANKKSRSFIDLDEALPREGKGGGLVFSQMTFQGRPFRALDDITPLGLTLKTSPDSSLAFVTYLKSGSPAKGVPVEIRGDSNKVLWTGRTDADGFADFPGWRQLGITEWKNERPALWAFARHAEGDALISSAMRGGIDPWRFNIQWEENPDMEDLRGSLFTERGVYRPGETVHLKGILRRLQKDDWAFPGLRTVQIKLVDPANSEAFNGPVSVSTMGTFQKDFPIPASARTGNWNLTVLTGSQAVKKRNRVYKERLYQSFRVEDYKPAAFEVKASPDQDSYMAGDTLNAKVEGWYLFGAPMAGADYETTVTLAPTRFTPPHWEEYDFSPSQRHDRNNGRSSSAGNGKLDAKGLTSVSAKLDGSDFDGDFEAVLEASVTSPDRQKLFAQSSVIVHRSNLYIGIKPSTTFTEKGKPWDASVVCVDTQGKVVTGVPLKVQMKVRQWISGERAGFGGRLQWFSESKDSIEKEWTLTSGASPLDLHYQPQATGEYYLTITAADEKARPAEGSSYFYVAGKGEAWWARQDNDLIELVPDKKEYKPGDTARIMVKSPYDACRAMVTVERETILSRWTTQLAGGADFITVPITDRSLPNVYVSVMLVKGRAEGAKYDEEGLDLAKPQAKFGYVNLNVNPGGRRLSVKVKTDQEDYRPGQKVNLDLQVSDEGGRGAACEMAVFVVDEGVLALTGYQTPDPFESFYGPRSLKVLTADSRLFVIGQRSFGEKGQERGGGGGLAGLAGIDLRSNFIPTAFFDPTVTTDGGGHAKLSFKLPDNLSRFRVMAVALDEKRFGKGEGRLTVNKHLVLRPSLPRFARMGDDFQGGVVVHNDGTKPMDVLLNAQSGSDAVSMDPKEPLLRHLQLKPGSAQEVLFHFHASHLGQGEFQFRAKAGDDTDGLEWKLPVEPFSHLETAATSGATTEGAVEQVVLPDGATPDVGGLTWSFSSSALAGLQNGARFLLEYPYGCLEQRMSKCLPIVTGAKMLESFGLGKYPDLRKGVQDVLDKVPEFQHESGGYCYWTDDKPAPDPWLTAYALDVMHAAQKDGYTMPQDSIEKAKNWMGQALAESDHKWAFPYSLFENLETQAYMVYADALWGGKPVNYFDKLYDRRDQLPVLGEAYLLKAAALLAPGDSRQKTLAQELMNRAKVEARGIHFEENGGYSGYWWVHETSVNNTAICLQALLEAQGGFPNDEKAVRWLLEERKDQDWWRTTNENGSVLWALGDYYRHYEKKAPNFTATLTQEGSDGPLWTEKFQGRDLLTRIKELTLSSVFSAGTTARFHADKEGEGRLYYTETLRYYPSKDAGKANFQGYAIEKSIKPLEGSLDDLKAGTRAVVTLKVHTTQDHNFVVIDDPLPGGFEIVDPSYATEGKVQQKNLTRNDDDWGWYWGEFSRNEKYDDRIELFANYLTAGDHTYSYLVQATTPGQFTIPSTWAESMYEPENFGRTAAGAVTIAK